MQKRIYSQNTKWIIIIFTFWGLTLLASKWFYSEMYETFTPFLLFIPLGLLFIWTIAFGIWALVLLTRKFRIERFISAIPILLFLICIFLYLFAPFTILKVKLEYYLYKEDRSKIVADIQNGKLFDDGIGNVELPANLKKVSCDGEAYIYENNIQGTVIGFWSFRGLLMNPYHSVIYTSYDEPPTKEILQSEKIYETKKLDDHWYWVYLE